MGGNSKGKQRSQLSKGRKRGFFCFRSNKKTIQFHTIEGSLASSVFVVEVDLNFLSGLSFDVVVGGGVRGVVVGIGGGGGFIFGIGGGGGGDFVFSGFEEGRIQIFFEALELGGFHIQTVI